MMLRSTLACALAITLLAGCGREAPPAGDTTPDTTAGMQDTAGMAGMGGDTEMQRMTAHLGTVRALRGDALVAALPEHRQRVANMIARMNREMRDMGMAADAAWDATVDSLRADLVHMPEMSAAELEQLMPEHAGRAERLLEMHERMMAQMHR